MLVWVYDDQLRQPTSSAAHDYRACIHCATSLTDLTLDSSDPLNPQTRLERSLTVKTCPTCGWWLVGRQHQFHLGDLHVNVQNFCAEGVLRNFDLTDLSIPLEEVSRHLIARYSDRFKIHPRRYEEVVVSVFRNMGYRARITSYSNDDGVDAVIMDGERGDLIGVQAKRYSGKIEAHQIREFAGALILQGITQGIFVTTSSYTKGAYRTSENFARRLVAIDLMDAERFYSALKIARRPPYQTASDPDAPYRHLVRDVSKIPFIGERRLYIGF